MKHFFLGQGSNIRGCAIWRHLFAFGTQHDADELTDFLAEHYRTLPSRVLLTSSGRAAITLALEAMNLPKHSCVIVNGFTCFAVVQAVRAAGLVPVYADISADSLHYPASEVERLVHSHKVSAIIIQNTLGLPADYQGIVAVAQKHNLRIIEDLAHCTGLRYSNGAEMGTIGDATCLSFGKGKSIDTTTGGACIIMNRPFAEDSDGHPPVIPDRPARRPRLSDSLRARWYPVFASIGRFFTRIHLERYYYGLMIRIHFITRAVDFPLDTHTRPSYWQCRLALRQIRATLAHARPIRTHTLVDDRDAFLASLEKNRCHFREIWYDVPVAPVRYYHDLHYPESDCPTAVEVSKHIINIPNYYDQESAKQISKIVNSIKGSK